MPTPPPITVWQNPHWSHSGSISSEHQLITESGKTRHFSFMSFQHRMRHWQPQHSSVTFVQHCSWAVSQWLECCLQLRLSFFSFFIFFFLPVRVDHVRACCCPAFAHGPVPNARWRSSVCLLCCWLVNVLEGLVRSAAHLALVVQRDYRLGWFHHCDVISPLWCACCEQTIWWSITKTLGCFLQNGLWWLCGLLCFFLIFFFFWRVVGEGYISLQQKLVFQRLVLPVQSACLRAALNCQATSAGPGHLTLGLLIHWPK